MDNDNSKKVLLIQRLKNRLQLYYANWRVGQNTQDKAQIDLLNDAIKMLEEGLPKTEERDEPIVSDLKYIARWCEEMHQGGKRVTLSNAVERIASDKEKIHATHEFLQSIFSALHERDWLYKRARELEGKLL